MNISILCTDPTHPVFPHLEVWVSEKRASGHNVTLCADRSELSGGDLLFLVSCSQIVRSAERARFRATIVLHASDLPRGRGWSPHIWSIVAGARQFCVCAMEAADPVDTGPVWLRTSVELEGHELLPEINAKLFAAELGLMSTLVDSWGDLQPVPQRGEPGPYMPKRSPEHSRLDPEKTIAAQFELLRVVDNARYPAFFDFRGHRYLVRIEKDQAQ
jgi:methionyl-tRNA formyltransferase